MNERLNAALNVGGSNNILPFMWAITGIDTKDIVGQMEIIRSCGIRSVCVESRTFEDFAGDTWWPLIEEILKEAKRLGMRVWILDDTHFPTGYAAGWIEKKYPERRRLQLAEFHVDVIGPRRTEIRLCPFSKEDELLAVVAVKRTGKDEELLPETILVDAKKEDPYFSFTAPSGAWRVFQLWLTHEGSSSGRQYINMIDPESVQVLVDAVYEAHYEHVSAYFGKELAGFFSDEPCFGNNFITKRITATHTHNHNKSVGMPGLAMPWRKGLEAVLGEKTGRSSEEIIRRLPLLWFDGEGKSETRVGYMDTVSVLYGKHFAGRLGAWCRAHGVEYIGHIIEDNGGHCRLGGSPGHYFRSMEGQDMAGLDVVLTQILPGFVHTDHAGSLSTKRVEPLFYSFMLPKLGPSLAHIRPHMKNRTMCEVFGAYGWALDTPMMKYLVDHFLVFGTTHFVPHAFSPLYPNSDCPPHFYGGGENPQFDDFSHLMHYLGNMTTLLEGNRVAKAAVLYHAEMEWSGESFITNDEISRVLTEAQIDFDIVPAEDLRDAKVENGLWRDGNGEFRLLVVPGAEYLPDTVIRDINRLMDEGLSVVQAEIRTRGLNAKILMLPELVPFAEKAGARDIIPEKEEIYLRALHVKHEDSDVFMFFNESVVNAIDTRIQLPVTGKYTRMDILGGKTDGANAADGCVSVRLSPYESVVYVFDGTDAPAPKEEPRAEEALDVLWDISVACCENMTEYRVLDQNVPLRTIEKDLPNFAGRICYSAKIENGSGIRRIALENVGDTACITVNGKLAGRRICAPFVFDTDGLFREGTNEISIVISTTLARKHMDFFSNYIAMNPPGLDGKVNVFR